MTTKEQIIALDAAEEMLKAEIIWPIHVVQARNRILSAIEKASTQAVTAALKQLRLLPEHYQDPPWPNLAAQPQRSEGQHGSDGMPPLRGPASGAASSEPQEWTFEYIRELEAEGGLAGVLSAHNAALADAWDNGYNNAEDRYETALAGEQQKRRILASNIEHEIEQALAAAQEDKEQLGRQLSESVGISAKLEVELASERERRKPLVEALEHIEIQTVEPRCAEVAKEALASVKDVMDYDTGLI